MNGGCAYLRRSANVSIRDFTSGGAGSPINNGPAGEWSSQVNSLAANFALRAIEAQPADYLRRVWHATFESFSLRRDPNPAGQFYSLYLFPAVAPKSLRAIAAAGWSGEYPYYQYPYIYNGGGDPSTRLVQPFAEWIRAYQRFIVVPGPLLGVIVLVGLLGGAALLK